MNRSRRAYIPVVIATVFLSSCVDEPTSPGGTLDQGRVLDQVDPQTLLSDGAHGDDGNPHFFFLPPIVPTPEPGPQGEFNPDLNPTVQICEVVDGACLRMSKSDDRPPYPDGKNTIRMTMPSDEHAMTLRPAVAGDRIQPFGMKGSRLVFDVLSEAGIPRFMKERTWLLTDGERVVWIPGVRASEATRIKSGDADLYEFSWKADKSNDAYFKSQA